MRLNPMEIPTSDDENKKIQEKIKKFQKSVDKMQNV